MARACEAIEAFKRGSKEETNVRGKRKMVPVFSRGATFQHGRSSLDPIRVDYSDPESGELVIVIMPMRI